MLIWPRGLKKSENSHYNKILKSWNWYLIRTMLSDGSIRNGWKAKGWNSSPSHKSPIRGRISRFWISEFSSSFLYCINKKPKPWRWIIHRSMTRDLRFQNKLQERKRRKWIPYHPYQFNKQIRQMNRHQDRHEFPIIYPISELKFNP